MNWTDFSFFMKQKTPHTDFFWSIFDFQPSPMLSNIFSRLLPSIRSANTSQRSVLRLLSSMKEEAPATASTDRQKGTVRRFSKEKGYGFITKESDGTDCFVQYVPLMFDLSSHRTCVFSFKNINTSGFKTLLQGQEVEFSTAQGEKGLEAKVSEARSMERWRRSMFSGGESRWSGHKYRRIGHGLIQ